MIQWRDHPKQFKSNCGIFTKIGISNISLNCKNECWGLTCIQVGCIYGYFSYFWTDIDQTNVVFLYLKSRALSHTNKICIEARPPNQNCTTPSTCLKRQNIVLRCECIQWNTFWIIKHDILKAVYSTRGITRYCSSQKKPNIL